MKKIYLETSAINRAVESGTGGANVASAFHVRGLIPAIGLHTVYEVAKTYLDDDDADRAQLLFALIYDLDPSIVPETSNLLKQEVLKLRTNSSVLPFYGHLNQAAARLEIARLKAGTFDSAAREFIDGREKEAKSEDSRFRTPYLEHVSRVKARKTTIKIKRFEDALAYFEQDFKDLIHDILKGINCRVTVSESLELSVRLNEFPVLQSTVRANIYRLFIFIAHGTAPASDRGADCRHIVDASYSDLLVTSDAGLLRLSRLINSDLEAVSWKDLFAR